MGGGLRKTHGEEHGLDSRAFRRGGGDVDRNAQVRGDGFGGLSPSTTRRAGLKPRDHALGTPPRGNVAPCRASGAARPVLDVLAHPVYFAPAFRRDVMRTFARTSILVVAAGLAGFIALRAVTPLEPRAQHTVRLCVDRPPVATKLLRSQQFLSGGEIVAVFTPADFGLDSVSSARLAPVEDDKVAVRYFAVRVQDQAATSARVVVVVNGAGARVLREGQLYPLRVEGAGSAGRGLLELSVFVDPEVSTQGDGRCPGAVRS